MAVAIPELWKELTSKGRYDRLVGHLNALQMQLEVLGDLIGRYTEPDKPDWQIPSREELVKAHKDAVSAVGTLRRRLRKSEIDLISKPWKVTW